MADQNSRPAGAGRFTLDRGMVTMAVPVLVDEPIGATRYLTPEGFLLCEGVRIARVGRMPYTAAEVPEVEPDSTGLVMLDRGADALFAPETLASFQGKPVTDDHPEDLLTPEDCGGLSCGTVINPRQGDGALSDYLIADLLLTSKSAIEAVQSGKREVSCGYARTVEQIRPGLGRMTRVVGNHVALVDRGRCGPSCAIQDKETVMAEKPKRTVWDRLTTAFKANDTAAFTEELEAAKAEASKDNDGPEIHVHLPPQVVVAEPDKDKVAVAQDDDNPMDARLAKLEAMVAALVEKVEKMTEAEKAEAEVTMKDTAEEVEEAEEKEKAASMDSASLAVEFRETRSLAEILAPGIALPAFDAKAGRKLTVDAMCGLRRKALATAYASDAMRPHVQTVLAGAKPAFDKMACDHLTAVFNGAAALAKAANGRSAPTADKAPMPAGGPMTAARYAEMIAQRRASGMQ